MGKTPFEAAQIDAIMEIANDLFHGVRVIGLKEVYGKPEQSVSIVRTKYRMGYH